MLIQIHLYDKNSFSNLLLVSRSLFSTSEEVGSILNLLTLEIHLVKRVYLLNNKNARS
jgi:hypothetical protein